MDEDGYGEFRFEDLDEIDILGMEFDKPLINEQAIANVANAQLLKKMITALEEGKKELTALRKSKYTDKGQLDKAIKYNQAALDIYKAMMTDLLSGKELDDTTMDGLFELARAYGIASGYYCVSNKNLALSHGKFEDIEYADLKGMCITGTLVGACVGAVVFGLFGLIFKGAKR